MYYLTDFKHFVSIFSLIFNPIDPLLLLILDLFDPSFSQNLRSDWVQFCFACCTQLPNIWWSTTPSPPFPGLNFTTKSWKPCYPQIYRQIFNLNTRVFSVSVKNSIAVTFCSLSDTDDMFNFSHTLLLCASWHHKCKQSVTPGDIISGSFYFYFFYVDNGWNHKGINKVSRLYHFWWIKLSTVLD